MSKSNIFPLTEEEERPNRLSFTLEEMLEEFENGAVPRSKYWKELITALYDTANHVVTGVTSVADVKPDNVGNIPLLPKDIDAPAMVRMDGADSNNQQTNQDVFGRSLFYGDACKVVHQYGAYYEVLAGPAYVAGIRFFYSGMQELFIEEVPNKVWVDVSWPSDPMQVRTPVIEIKVKPEDQKNYIDNDFVQHYLSEISFINQNRDISDRRNINTSSLNAVTHISKEEAKNDNNINRNYISIGDEGGRIYHRVNSDDFSVDGDRNGFRDSSGAWWEQEKQVSNDLTKNLLHFELNFGFNNNQGVDTEIYPGAEKAVQGICYDSRTNKVFVTQRPEGDNYSDDERIRIIEFNNGISSHLSFSELLHIGHGQDLSCLYEGDQLYLYSWGSNIHWQNGTTNPSDTGKTISKIRWRGSSTTQSNVQNFQLFPLHDSEMPFSEYYRATPVLSENKEKIVCVAFNSNGEANAPKLFVFDRQSVESSNLTIPENYFDLVQSRGKSSRTIQGIYADNYTIHIIFGSLSPVVKRRIDSYDYFGNLISRNFISPVISENFATYYNHSQLGVLRQCEPEGLTYIHGSLATVMLETWIKNGVVVSFKGQNFALISTSAQTGTDIYNGAVWIPTSLGVNSGEWNPEITYLNSDRPSYETTRRAKKVYLFGSPKHLSNGLNNSPGVGYSPESSIHLHGNTTEVSWDHGTVLQMKGFSESTGRYFYAHSFTYNGHRIYNGFDYDNPLRYSLMIKVGLDRDYFQIRGRGDVGNSASINLYGPDDPSHPGRIQTFTDGDLLSTRHYKNGFVGLHSGAGVGSGWSNTSTWTFQVNSDFNPVDDRKIARTQGLQVVGAKESGDTTADYIVRFRARTDDLQDEISRFTLRGNGYAWLNGWLRFDPKEDLDVNVNCLFLRSSSGKLAFKNSDGVVTDLY